ncbi:MAG: TraR/DksA family transcriptional regulator [Gammaproteobacteria bacterium]|nr:TraR/DksA family transcriptional regulator [Gammaproteobacteria bacterium]
MSTLTNAQLKQLRQLLNSRLTELLEEVRQEMIASGDQHYIDLAAGVMDVGDESVADMLTDMNAALFDRHIQEIRDVEAAQLRMADLSYGACIDCGATTGYDRLAAYPTAKRCYECQSQHEKRYAHEATPRL